MNVRFGDCQNTEYGYSCFERQDDDMCIVCEECQRLHEIMKGVDKTIECAVCCDEFETTINDHSNVCSEECREQLEDPNSEYWKKMNGTPFAKGGTYQGEKDRTTYNTRSTIVSKEGGI